MSGRLRGFGEALCQEVLDGLLTSAPGEVSRCVVLSLRDASGGRRRRSLTQAGGVAATLALEAASDDSSALGAAIRGLVADPSAVLRPPFRAQFPGITSATAAQ
eukprot:21385-Chlamydomonas_euryale.AAC.1